MSQIKRSPIVLACLLLWAFLLPSSAVAQSGVTYVYDDLGRLVGVIDPSGNAAAYNYDAVGNLLSISRYTSAQVSVLNFTPTRGPVGTTVTITGTGFSTTLAQNTVTFNGTAATVTTATVNKLVVTVPSGATTGPISVTTPAGTFTTTSVFTVTVASAGAPTITSFTPTIATAGTPITITGTNFDPNRANDQLLFNITNQFVSSATSTSLSATVPGGTGSGRLTVTTPDGSAQSAQDLFIPFGTHVAADVGFTGRTTIGASQPPISLAGKIGIVVFDATAGQKVSVTVSGSTFNSCTLYLFSPTGAPLRSTGCSTGYAAFLDTTLLSVTGTYALGLEPSTTTGVITLQVNNAPDVTGTITLDGTTVPKTTMIPGQDIRLTFTGTAGRRVSMNVFTQVNYFNIVLLDPNGVTLTSGCVGTGCGSTTRFFAPQTLPSNGTYTIVAQHNYIYTGTVNFQAWDVPPDVSGTITQNGPAVPVTIAAPGQQANLTFSGTQNRKISLTTESSTISSGTIYVKKPDGTQLTSFPFGTSNGFMDAITLPTTGTYTLNVQADTTGTGSVTIKLYDATEVTGTITIGGSAVTLGTTVPGQSVQLTFSGAALQKISLGLTPTTVSNSNAYIYNPDGSTLASQFNIGSGGGYIDTVTVPTTGTYKIYWHPNGGLFGNMTFNLYDATPISGTIAINGASVHLNFNVPGKDANLTFSGTAGQQVTIRITNNNYTSGFNLNLLKPDGTPIGAPTWASGPTFNWTPPSLPTTGTYTITFQHNSYNTGQMDVALTSP